MNSGSRRLLRYFLAVYWVACFLSTHIPATDLPATLPPGVDKLVHIALFSGLGFLFFLTQDRLRGAGVRFVVGCLLASGLFDESTQPLTGRAFEFLDIVADGVGALVGSVVAAWVDRT